MEWLPLSSGLSISIAVSDKYPAIPTQRRDVWIAIGIEYWLFYLFYLQVVRS